MLIITLFVLVVCLGLVRDEIDVQRRIFLVKHLMLISSIGQQAAVAFDALLASFARASTAARAFSKASGVVVAKNVGGATIHDGDVVEGVDTSEFSVGDVLYIKALD